MILQMQSILKPALSLCFAFAALLPMTSHAYGDVPVPRIKPAPANLSSLLIRADAANFRRAMRTAEAKRWSDAQRYASRINDPIAKRVINWKRAADDPSVNFSVLTNITQNHSHWPRMTRIRSNAEKRIFRSRMTPDETIDWFRGVQPVSGEGRAALADAYFKKRQNEIGKKWLRSAWRDSKLTRDGQKYLFGKYKKHLTKDDHAARADHLIWLGRGHYSKANALLMHMGASDRKLMDARMRVGANRSGMDAAVKAVPAKLQRDTGLLFERARWRRKRKSEFYALEVHKQMAFEPRTEKGKERLWIEKSVMAKWAIKKKRYREAYNLTLNHGMTRGEKFADAEFMAGWLALTYLKNPKLAEKHFISLRDGVSLPVSKARAHYWLGRAADAQQQSSSAHYAQAAHFPNTYYGQLAQERLSNSQTLLQLPPERSPRAFHQKFENLELIRALRIIGETGSERTFNQFSFHLDDIFNEPEELSLLSAIGKEYGYMKPSVRAAKQAARLGTMLTESGYPKPTVFINLPAQFDKPFALSIARQESEFNTHAASHARAYGMMQMINATAKSTARRAKLPYRKSWLMGDPEYAAKLGSHHIDDLLDDFDGSYIMAAAAYNAGARRVRQWNKAYGDPRKGQIDPIDWVESIPFSETRNYVQRVMENMQVYRARLDGNRAPLRLMHHLKHGTARG